MAFSGSVRGSQLKLGDGREPILEAIISEAEDNGANVLDAQLSTQVLGALDPLPGAAREERLTGGGEQCE